MSVIMNVPVENITDDYLHNMHPGTILRLDYFPEMHVTEYKLAKLLGITQTHLAELLAGKRGVTANISLRLGLLFGQSPELWLGMQASYDILKARRQYAEEYAKIAPFAWPSAEAKIDQAA